MDRTEPFPPDLFRVPVPDAVFSEMPSMSDSALRCLLALIEMSFRFDPADGEWMHPGEWFSRREVEEACGLSSQGARNGLAELEDLGWARVDRSGRTHRHRLQMEVPSRRYTYLPTSLLETAPDIGSGTALRIILAVLRRTWGWTDTETNPASGEKRVVHDRWTRLPAAELARATGRSERAVKAAAKAIQGEWIGRVRPGNGPYQCRFLSEAVGPAPPDDRPPSGRRPNFFHPDRQNSAPPTYNRGSFPRDKQGEGRKEKRPRRKNPASDQRGRAVPPSKPSGSKPSPSRQDSSERQSGAGSPPPDFSDLSPEKRQLAEKLANVGVWAGRIAELLSRFSAGRIRANFQLYRRRASNQTIRKPGAWLHQAITEGYALPGEGPTVDGKAESDSAGPLPPLEHKETVSEMKKDAYVAEGISEERFHRCLSGDGSSEPKFMYFAPGTGGPDRRRDGEQALR